MRDLRSFTIPCAIGESGFKPALWDLRVNVNLISLSIFRRLGIDEAKPARIALQLADCSIKHPFGVIENMLVKVGTSIYLTDFVVLDMEEDQNFLIS